MLGPVGRILGADVNVGAAVGSVLGSLEGIVLGSV